MLQILKKYPLSLLCIALVWYLSIWFLPPDYIELPSINFLDKWTHFVMYGTLSLTIWYEYRRHHSRPCYRHLFFWGWLAPIAMSGLLELLQEYATVTRSGEWTDWAANATGATIGSVLGLLLLRL